MLNFGCIDILKVDAFATPKRWLVLQGAIINQDMGVAIAIDPFQVW